MLFQNIHFIINPASGKTEAILSYIQHALCKTTINWAVTVAVKQHDCYSIASGLIGQTDLVVIYGGDGSISQIARALCGSNTPMAIIPGGTANILSKELNIPQHSRDALALIIGGETQMMQIDMGIANGCPFVLRVNMGVMADMILEVDNLLKEKLGQVAYGISALKTAAVAKPQTYKLVIDGETFIETGVLLTVTNAGSIGIGHIALFPGISISDGFLDVILMHDTDPLSVLQVAGSTLFHKESEVLKHWRCKEVVIAMDESTHYICDDSGQQATNIHIKIIPLALNVLVAAIKS